MFKHYDDEGNMVIPDQFQLQIIYVSYINDYLALVDYDFLINPYYLSKEILLKVKQTMADTLDNNEHNEVIENREILDFIEADIARTPYIIAYENTKILDYLLSTIYEKEELMNFAMNEWEDQDQKIANKTDETDKNV